MTCRAAVLVALLSAACAPAGPVVVPAGPMAPRFADYPSFEAVAPAAPAADRGRAAGRDGAFAGHLAVAELDCGAGCQRFAFVDGRSGRVIPGPTAAFGASYRPDSRLFVVNPPERLPVTAADEPEPPAATEYWLWTGDALERIAVPA